MDTELLISKIIVREAIWNKKNASHSNRNLVEKAWREISEEMEFDECKLRAKWKYLKDEFAKQLGSMKIFSGDPAYVAKDPKWVHFRSLYFLKDIVRPRYTSGNVTKTPAKDKEVEVNDSPAGNETCGSSDILDSEPLVMLDTPGSSGQISPLPQLAPTHTSTPQTSAPVKPSTPRSSAPGPPNKKVKLTNAAHNKAMLEIESKKVEAIGELLSRRKENEDEDLLFFRSLLSHVKRIPEHKKLQFRAHIQEVVVQHAYEQEPTLVYEYVNEEE
ncbi:hypothetical protein JTE90_028984 [Oedothorax gibbosus]|uniref:MADF domain-containing protein n=1 Tax=Oedothorax gibbosus TaxID=931172 RepID=A0AAV6VJC6_9ARAC|nr:hypothetical protein JTE90_028984 [Oedothorax gibbosus]